MLEVEAGGTSAAVTRTSVVLVLGLLVAALPEIAAAGGSGTQDLHAIGHVTLVLTDAARNPDG